MAVTQGCLETSEGLQLPLQGTDVRVEVTGPLAEVALEQTFTNPLDRSIEATYQFPLPHGAAVWRMRFEVNGRIVENVVKELEAARQDFARARQEGRRATLLEQQKPNLFTMSLTHIQPGETIKVTMSYFELLDFEEGRYRWTFPMVAADRHPGDRPPSGDVEQLRVRRVASRQRTPDVVLRVSLGDDEAAPHSPTHDLHVEGGTVTLAPGDALPNRDFVLYWTALASQLYLHRAPGEDGTFLFQLLAPQDVAAEVPPQNLLILLDRSCSMRGQTMEQARRAVDHVLSVLRPEDRVQIVAFDHDLEKFTCEQATPENVGRARAWLRDLAPRGGTDLELALKQIEANRGRGGSVLLITDASVGNEEHLLARYTVQGRPLHVLGIGASVNRYLVEKLARQGEGTCQYLTPFEDATPVLARLGRRLLQAAPTLFDLRLEWPEASLYYPQTLPPLYEREPLVLVGRFRGEGPTTLVVRGKRQDGREYRLEKAVELPAEAPALSGLERLWAQRRIAASTDRLEIIRLAERYSLASRYTAFIGVDSAEVNRGTPLPVTVAVEEVAGSPGQMRAGKLLAREDKDKPMLIRGMRAKEGAEAPAKPSLSMRAEPPPPPRSGLFGARALRSSDALPPPPAAPAADFGPLDYPADPFASAAPSADPFAAGMVAADPFGASADPFGAPCADPFAAPAADPFGAPPVEEVDWAGTRPAADPFAGGSGAPAVSPADAFGAAGGCDPFPAPRPDEDPFGPSRHECSFGGPPVDPFAPPVRDPFAAAPPPDPFAPPPRDPFADDPFGAAYDRKFGPPPPAWSPAPPLPPELRFEDYGADELDWAKGKLDGALDLVFLVDETGSMGAFIQVVQQQLLRIIETISSQPLCRTLQVGLVRYRDHPPQDHSYVTKVHALTAKVDEIREAVLTMHADGGGDAPEAVTDGLFELVNLNWRPGSVRTVVWIGDAPPHGVCKARDGFPNGCPCGRHWYAQAESCREMGIAVHGVICGHADVDTQEVFKLVSRTARGVCVSLDQAPLLVPLITGVAARDLDRLRIEGRVAELLAAHEAARQLEREDQVEFLWARLMAGNIRARTLEFTGQVVRSPDGIWLKFRDLTPEDVEAALAGLEFRTLERACF